MRRYLVLMSCLLLFGGTSAFAQTTYQVTTVPTFVTNTGRAEVLGGVRITASNAGPTIASTVQYLYEGVACDNTTSNGVTLTRDNTVFTSANSTIQTVTNTSAGCVVSVAVNGGITTTPTSWIEIDGVRGRVDFLGGLANVGQSINAQLSATPSNSSLFTVPNVGTVGITAVGLEDWTGDPQLTHAVSPGTVLKCILIGTRPVIKIMEGYNGTFVQNVTTAAGTTVPASARPLYGAVNNSQVHFAVTALPSGVTLTWPSTVCSQLGCTTAGVSGSQLERLTNVSSTATTQTYEYSCGSQATCDLTQEKFAFTLGLAASTGAAIGTGVVAINLYPPLASNDVTTTTAPPFGAYGANTAPRFNDPPRGPFAVASDTPCTTNLLFPWMAFMKSAGYDTGFAIANTSSDPYGTSLQNGQTCTLNFFPTNDTTLGTAPAALPVVAMTTPAINGGATFATNLSDISAINVADFTGYMIAVCNFQYGHGFAFITNNIGQSSALAQGYNALIIPDPNILKSLGMPRDPGTDATLDALLGFSLNLGEGLSQ